MALVIVESPNKTQKIKKALGSGYTVMASLGHIFDLEKKNMGIDLEKWQPQYKVSDDKVDLVKKLKDAAKEHEEIYIATDPDIEGWSIAFNLKDIFPKSKTIYRVTLDELVDKEIKKAFKNPVPFDENIFRAQQTRRMTDRLTGFKISPILWAKGLKHTSAGRVQSPVLKWLVDKEREIKAFQKKEYWSLHAEIMKDLIMDLSMINSKKLGDLSKSDIDTITKDLNKSMVITSIESKVRTRSPVEPFTTASLQQDANNKFGWDSKRIMDVAQSLFAGGNISYHRCFPAGTKISTINGFLSIENIKIGQMVDTLNGPFKVIDIVKNINRQIYNLETEHGYRLDGSENEPLLVLQEDLSLIWKKLEDIKTGEYVSISNKKHFSEASNKTFNYMSKFDKEINIKNKLTCEICQRDDLNSLAPHLKKEHKLTGKEYLDLYKKTRLHTCLGTKISLPEKMTPKLAKLLGYLLSEGSFGKNKKTIIFYNNEQELLEDFKDTFNSVFGDNTKLYDNAQRFEKNSFYIWDFLNWLGLEPVNAPNKRVPWSILESSNDCIIAFLKAFWEGDGSYNTIFSASKNLIQELKLLLLKIGIPTTTFTRLGNSNNSYSIDNAPCYSISFHGKSLDTFLNSIGTPISLKKQAQVKKLLEKSESINRKEHLWHYKIPYTSNIMKNLIKKHMLSGGWIKNQKIRVKTNIGSYKNGYLYCSELFSDWGFNYNTKSKFSRLDFIKLVEPDLYTKINIISEKNIIFDKVISNRFEKSADTWDLTVENEHHYIANGFIAHNTDSVRISPEKIDDVRQRIENDFGKSYVSPDIRIYKNSDAAQDAHEAIRPTFEPIPTSITVDENRLLELITNRFYASQMSDAVFEQSKIEGEVTGQNKYQFIANGSILKFDGFLKVYGSSTKDNLLPKLTQGDTLTVKKFAPAQHFTKPPTRYSDASIVSEMERTNIGRPSTYASVLDTLEGHKYIIREGKYLKPTERGMMVSDYLSSFFKNFTNVEFTAKLEKEMDQIMAGKLTKDSVMDDFYKLLTSELDAAKHGNANDLFKTEHICPKCQGNMIKKISDLGVMLGCSNYPKCGQIMKFDKEGNIIKDEVETGSMCPECGEKIVKKKGKYGEYFVCLGYPACNWKGKVDQDGTVVTKKAIETLGIKCPNCKSGELVKRTGSYGSFAACNRYPTCKSSFNFDENGEIIFKDKTEKKSKVKTKSTGETCPKCKTGDIIVIEGKFGPFKGCTNYRNGCKYMGKI